MFTLFKIVPLRSWFQATRTYQKSVFCIFFFKEKRIFQKNILYQKIFSVKFPTNMVSRLFLVNCRGTRQRTKVGTYFACECKLRIRIIVFWYFVQCIRIIVFWYLVQCQRSTMIINEAIQAVFLDFWTVFLGFIGCLCRC